MPCLGLKIVVGTQFAGILTSGIVAGAGAPTVVISAAALAAMAVQFAGICASMVLLANCLDAAERHADADSLRRELDALKLEVERMPH